MKVACVVYYAFLGVLRYLNKACVFFCAKYFNKKNKTVLITSISILLSFSHFTTVAIKPVLLWTQNSMDDKDSSRRKR